MKVQPINHMSISHEMPIATENSQKQTVSKSHVVFSDMTNAMNKLSAITALAKITPIHPTLIDTAYAIEHRLSRR